MTQDEVVFMLAEAIDQDREYKSWHVSTKHLMTLAKMVAEKEREACALICDDHADDPVYCGEAIRARGQA